MSLTVAIEDASGNVITANNSTVTVVVAGGPARLANGSTTSVAAVNGVATFNSLFLNTVGTYTLSVSDGSLTGATSGSITVSAGAASKLFVSQAPGAGTAGQALNPGVTVTVQDAYGNAVTSNTSTVTLAVGSGPGGFASGSTLSATAVKGVAPFSNVILNAAGNYALVASANSLTSGSSTPITINAAAASKLFVSQTPATGSAGQALNPGVTVSVQDAFGNVITSNTSTVTLAVSSGPAGFATGTTTSVAAVGGVATFSNLLLNTAGNYVLNATDGALTAAKSSSITVNPAAATKLVLLTTPTTGTAGKALGSTLQIAIEDQFGNVASANTSTVTVAAASGPAAIANTSTVSVVAVNGVATFNKLIFNTAGTYTLKVSDGCFDERDFGQHHDQCGGGQQTRVHSDTDHRHCWGGFDPGHQSRGRRRVRQRCHVQYFQDHCHRQQRAERLCQWEHGDGSRRQRRGYLQFAVVRPRRQLPDRCQRRQPDESHIRRHRYCSVHSHKARDHRNAWQRNSRAYPWAHCRSRWRISSATS